MDDDMRRRPVTEALEDATQFGVLEDGHLRVVVTTGDAATYVRLEGELDREDVAVVGELLDAVQRWHRGLGRSGHGPRGQRAVVDPGRRARSSLLVDTRGVERCDPLGWRMLEDHQARWRAERGPCHLTGAQRHGSRR
jgi:hypothetical protein